MIAPSPIRTPLRILALDPTNTLFSSTTGAAHSGREIPRSCRPSPWKSLSSISTFAPIRQFSPMVIEVCSAMHRNPLLIQVPEPKYTLAVPLRAST